MLVRRKWCMCEALLSVALRGTYSPLSLLRNPGYGVWRKLRDAAGTNRSSSPRQRLRHVANQSSKLTWMRAVAAHVLAISPRAVGLAVGQLEKEQTRTGLSPGEDQQVRNMEMGTRPRFCVGARPMGVGWVGGLLYLYKHTRCICIQLEPRWTGL